MLRCFFSLRCFAAGAQGTTYGCTVEGGNATMWTEGCRGVFECDGKQGITCSVLNGVRTVCDCGPPRSGAAFSRGSTTSYNGVAALNETHGAFTYDYASSVYAVPFALV